MVDTHAHIEMCDDDPDAIVARARSAGVERILSIAIDGDTMPRTLAIAAEHDEVFAAVGWHPNASTGFGDEQAARIAEAARHPRVRAIGETGLDFYRDSAPPADQRRAFHAQLEIAAAHDLPVSIHARGAAAEAECVDTLLEHAGELPAVVLHCFSYPDQLERAVAAGFYCSFAGNVTFKNAPELRAAAARVPDELLLLETDAPFLAPQPRRGKRCEPAYVTFTAEAVATERGVTYEQLSETVSANARRVFNW